MLSEDCIQQMTVTMPVQYRACAKVYLSVAPMYSAQAQDCPDTWKAGHSEFRIFKCSSPDSTTRRFFGHQTLALKNVPTWTPISILLSFKTNRSIEWSVGCVSRRSSPAAARRFLALSNIAAWKIAAGCDGVELLIGSRPACGKGPSIEWFMGPLVLWGARCIGPNFTSHWLSR